MDYDFKLRTVFLRYRAHDLRGYDKIKSSQHALRQCSELRQSAVDLNDAEVFRFSNAKNPKRLECVEGRIMPAFMNCFDQIKRLQT